ncbi:hypothetical protein BwSH14_12160 [Bradyrhizobium ottawaense]|nr:hypothetical protein BwSH14_12160 [Bradyrhizobium ottawaense]GMO30555.1 hypothetical protein BwSF21_32240 [Bradyrhizobium ottawaense]GMO54113.1 hypothetical protein BwSG20_00400 [Bradyrhizobium ottawaense]GMO76463.1 hypothetical protein BwSH17_43070 [Bradyrhizobium ottawaense]GMO84551.1 hypothetical protein BwSF19_41560 [Bradyrhizobium ottawaense]
MMRQTYAMLANGATCLWFGQTVLNALIESFAIHARSLIEFFSGDSSPTDNTAAAKHFAKPTYSPCSNEGPGRTFMNKLNGQIAHPSYSRSDKPEDKLTADDRIVLMQFMEREVTRFSQEIKTTYENHWPSDMKVKEAAKDGAVARVLGPSGATGQFGSIGPTAPQGTTGPAGPTFTYRTGNEES